MNTDIRSRMEEFLSEELGNGNPYATVRTISKALKIKQTEVMDNIPDGYRMEPSAGGTLAENRIVQANDEQEVEMFEEVEERDPEEELEVEETDEEYEPEDYLVEDSDEEEVEEGPRVICEICGTPIRTTTEDQKGICPRCWGELVRNSKNSTKALLDMSEDDFAAVVQAERERRQFLVDYKASRVLTAEEFEAMKDTLIPVKTLFAAARAEKIGPGRVAQVVGGDKFRHEPLGGFGSIWTPFFFGARKAWYFDREVLNHLEDIKRAPKPPKEPKAETNGGAGKGRKGARGKAMKVVPADKVQSGQVG